MCNLLYFSKTLIILLNKAYFLTERVRSCILKGKCKESQADWYEYGKGNLFLETESADAARVNFSNYQDSVNITLWWWVLVVVVWECRNEGEKRKKKAIYLLFGTCLFWTLFHTLEEDGGVGRVARSLDFHPHNKHILIIQ